jgi:hypothetical protein
MYSTYLPPHQAGIRRTAVQMGPRSTDESVLEAILGPVDGGTLWDGSSARRFEDALVSQKYRSRGRTRWGSNDLDVWLIRGFFSCFSGTYEYRASEAIFGVDGRPPVPGFLPVEDSRLAYVTQASSQDRPCRCIVSNIGEV